MASKGSTEQRLLEEIGTLRGRIAELEASESRLKQAEESLAKSEAKFENIFENVREGIIYLDGKGTILDVNETAVQIYGGPKEELLGKHFIKVAVFGPRDIPALLENFRKVLSNETPVVTLKIKNKLAREIWLECTASVFGPKTEVARVLVIARDVTERKQAEEALRQSEERFRSIIEGAPVGYYRVGKDGLWQYVNPAWERMHGLSREEVVGKSFELTQPEDMVQQAREYVRRSLAGETITGEFGRLRKDGEVEYHSFNIQPVYHQGEITAIEGFINDITERKKAEKALRHSEERYRELADSITDVFFAMDRELKYTYWNKASENLTGISAKEAIGKSLYDLFPDVKGAEVEKFYLRAIEKRQPQFFENEYRVRGRTYIFEISAYPSKDGLSVFTRDVTERRKAEEALRESEEFSSNILSNSPNPMLVINEDSSIRYVNAALERLTGFSSAEVVGAKAPYLWWTEETLEKTSSDLRDAMGEGAKRLEELFQKKNGERFRVEITSVPIRDNGHFKYYLSAWVDITERKRAEEALRQSEERYRVLFDAAPVGIGTSDPGGNVIAANERMQEITGYTGEDLGSINLKSTYVNPGDREHLLSILRERGTVRDYEVRLKRKDGRTYDALLNVDIVDLGGRQVMYTCVRDISEQKRAETKIHELSQFRESIIETANVWLDVLDERANVVVWNKAAEEISGYSREEVLGHAKIWEWLYPDEGYRKEITTKAAAIIEKGEAVEDFETTIRCKNGDTKIISWHSRNLLGEKGNPIGSIALGRDVTERKKGEEALRASEEKFYKAFHTTSNLMGISTAKEGRIIDINDVYCRVVGYKREELIGRTTGEFSIWADPEQRNLVVQKLREEGRVHDLEVGIRSKSGDIRTVLFSADAITLNNEPCLINMAIDITERKKAEETLKRREEEMRLITDNVPALVSYVDREGHYRFVNERYEEWFGIPRTEILGKHFREILGEDAYSLIKDHVNGALSGKHVSYESKLPYTRGGSRWVKADYVPDVGDVGEVRGFFALVTDITERKKAEKALREALTEVERLRNRLEAENIYLQEEIKSQHDFEEIIGRSEKLKEVLLQVEQVAPTDSTVLILGETGTGKELIARAIHGISARQKRPLVKVNCSALPATLIESELFGYVKGAFTGATSSRIGRFELADGGTVFLDEIGDLPLELQVKLLRVLQDGEFERLGDPRTITVDVRVIAATNRDLEKAVETGRFREDLYYRLNVFPITLPALRERREDIPVLVKHFVSKYRLRTGKKIESIPQKALEMLQAYDWPGNVRELENVVERSVITSRGDRLELGEWPPKQARLSQTSEVSTLEEVEKNHIVTTLKVTGWRVSGERGAARVLGVNPKTLESRMKRLGIRRPSQ